LLVEFSVSPGEKEGGTVKKGGGGVLLWGEFWGREAWSIVIGDRSLGLGEEKGGDLSVLNERTIFSRRKKGRVDPKTGEGSLSLDPFPGKRGIRQLSRHRWGRGNHNSMSLRAHIVFFKKKEVYSILSPFGQGRGTKEKRRLLRL